MTGHPPPAIIARGLSRNFGTLRAVDGVDLEVPMGSVYGFLGPNGCGKTTTIRLLCGLLAPSSGSAEVLGIRLPGGAEALRRRIGYMTQRFSLFEDLTVTENLDFMGEIYSIPSRQRRQRITQLIEQFRLTNQARQRAGTLSGGQRQRLSLATAILHEPELLFLDEPTSAVDPENRREFWESLFELSDTGTTVLVSTHYMDEAERCHFLAILDRGKLVAEGKPRTLMQTIDASVVEIDFGSESPRTVREALAPVDGLLSVAQLGSRLRALLSRRIEEPASRIQEATAGLEVEARTVQANLEDVFVVATRHGPESRAADTGAGR